jgi:hypothetical protein
MTEKAEIPFVERLTCTITEGCRATGLGRTSLYQAIATGDLVSTKVHGRRLINVCSLIKYVNGDSGGSA